MIQTTRSRGPVFELVRWIARGSAILGLGLGPAMGVAGTDFVEAYRASVRPADSVWGIAHVGSATGTDLDPRAFAIEERLRAVVGRWLMRGAEAGAWKGALPAEIQQEARRQLSAAAGADIEVHLRPGPWTVMQIRGGVLETAVSGGGSGAGLSAAYPVDREETARRFLRRNALLLRLENPDDELGLESESRDELGRWHLRFEQRYGGLPVWPAGLSVHLDARGNVDLVDGAYVPTPVGMGTGPVVTAERAQQQAQRSVSDMDDSEAEAPELVVYAPLHGVARLAWKVELAVGFRQAWYVIVDAMDGRVLNRLTRVCEANVATSAPDLEGVRRDINVWSADGRFYLVDTTKASYVPGTDPIANPRGVITIFDAREVTENQLNTVFMIESDNASQWLPDGVSAAYNFSETFDYFQEHHGRNSLDGQGGNVRAAVRVAGMDNAFWNGNQQMMFFGNVRPYPAALDVVGHELAHGVTQFSADLIYELQPGALNESFSDIFGEMVEARTVGTPDWKIGTKLGRPFRDMKDPGSMLIQGLNRPYPEKMSEYLSLPNRADADNGGVHLNSSIINHCFYLLAEGLPGAVGRIDAERIFYRCLTQHLQKQSQFVDARLGCLAAAEALFGPGSVQLQKTGEAFDAVEIFATPPTPPPPPLPPVEGADSTLLVGFDPLAFAPALGRRETALGDPALGVFLVEFVQVARPSVSGDGSFAVFVDGANDLGFVDTADPSQLEFLGFPGQVHSVAMSPDAAKFAFVLRDPFSGQPDNQIVVIDVLADTTRAYTLLVPVADGNPADLVLNADAMVFTSTGEELIYDAVSEIRFGNGAPVGRWSIFRLDLASATTTMLVPPLEGYNTGNPNLGRAGNRYLTFDVFDLESGITEIANLDLFTGALGQVGTVGQLPGYPTFAGDEGAVIYAVEDAATDSGASLVRQALSEDRLAPVGQPTAWLSDAWLGVIYRRGSFTATNAPPTVVLTAPAGGAVFEPGATITLNATATDADGVARVEFYEGANKLGEDTTSPYGFSWPNVAAGSYRLMARATDRHGGSGDSIPVQITVGQSVPIRVAASRLAGPGVRITVMAAPGDYAIEESTTLTGWTTAFTLTVGGGGTATVDDTRPWSAGGRLFYRVRRN